jgi:hypothetical protein
VALATLIMTITESMSAQDNTVVGTYYTEFLTESANVAEQYLPEFSETPEPNVDANIDVINLVNAQVDAHFSQ